MQSRFGLASLRPILKKIALFAADAADSTLSDDIELKSRGVFEFWWAVLRARQGCCEVMTGMVTFPSPVIAGSPKAITAPHLPLLPHGLLTALWRRSYPFDRDTVPPYPFGCRGPHLTAGAFLLVNYFTQMALVTWCWWLTLRPYSGVQRLVQRLPLRAMVPC